MFIADPKLNNEKGITKQKVNKVKIQEKAPLDTSTPPSARRNLFEQDKAKYTNIGYGVYNDRSSYTSYVAAANNSIK